MKYMTPFKTRTAIRQSLLLIFILFIISLFIPLHCASAETTKTIAPITRYEGKRILGSSFNTLTFDEENIHVQIAIFLPGERGEMINACYLLGENGQLTPCENHCGDGLGYSTKQFVVSPSNTTYAIRGSGDIYRYTPHEEKKWTYLCSNPLIKAASNDIDYPPYYAASDTKLFEVCLHSKTGAETHSIIQYNWQVVSYDLETGERNELCVLMECDMPILYTMPDGTLMAGFATEKPFLRIHEDGTTEELFTSDLKRETMKEYECQSILYLEDIGCLMMVNGALYRIDDEGKTTLVNYTPPYKYNVLPRNCLMNLPGRNAVAYFAQAIDSFDTVLNIVSLEPQGTTVLRLGGVSLYRFDENNVYCPTFESTYPNSKVLIPSEYIIEDFADIATLLTTKDSTCDLYLVHTADDGLQRMAQKGYFVPLDDVPELTEFCQGLYPEWKSLVTNNQGQLVAMPVAVGGENAVGYWPSFWEENELGELPTTYGEMLDCICRWEEEGKLQDFNLVGYEKDSFAELTDLLLSSRAAYCASQNEPTVYSSDDLLPLLHQLDKMRPMLAANDRMHLTGTPAFWFHFNAGPMKRGSITEQRSLPLSLTSEQEAVVPRTLYVYIINPYSQHQAEAKKFLAMLAEKMDAVTRFGLVKSDAQGVEEANYAKNMAEAKREYAFCKEELRMCIEGGNDAETIALYEEFVNYWADRIEECEANRYDVIPEETDTYRRIMENPAVTCASGFALVKKNAQSTISAFNEGRISPEELCRKLDEVVRMWMMENE